jgi:Transposase IS4
LEYKNVSWKNNMKQIMSQDCFTEICSSLKFYPEHDHAVAVEDPLWNLQIMLYHFMKNAASMSVPKGCSALDENMICCKACTAARSYMKARL